MNGDQTSDFQQRQNESADAKKVRPEKFRSAAADPTIAERAAVRAALNKTREVRIEARKTTQKLQEAEQAEEERRKMELAMQTARDAEKADIIRAAEISGHAVALAAKQKALRDTRYAERKAAKKQRRKG